MQRILCFIVVSFLLSIGSSVVSEASPNGKAAKHFAKGLQFYSEENFEAAAAKLQESYEIKEKQQTLFAWAQAERMRGDCKTASRLLIEYIANGATAKQSEAAYSVMRKCKEETEDGISQTLEREKTKKVEDSLYEEKNSITHEPVVKDSLQESRELAHGSDSVSKTSKAPKWVGISLLALGGVGAGVAGYYYSRAYRVNIEASDARNVGEYTSRIAEARGLQKRSIVFGVAGGALLSAGILYFWIRDSKTDTQSSAVSFLLIGKNALVSLSGTF